METGEIIRRVMPAQTTVTGGSLEQKQQWMPECGVLGIVWGIRLQFSNGVTRYVPDLCDRMKDAQRLLNRLLGASLHPDFLSDILEDYLGELYGPPIFQENAKEILHGL